MSTANLVDWEDSKENVLPLRGGRDPAMLSEAFKLKDAKVHQQKLMNEKQYVIFLSAFLLLFVLLMSDDRTFETTIQNDTSADPLDAWIK